ncbi:MAG TPA: hypothetical protein VF473_00080, partial [Cyclobacteriaceae bacterium]
GGYRPAPVIDKSTYKKYDTPAPVLVNYYVLAQYIVCLVATSLLLFNEAKLTTIQKEAGAVLISWWVVNCGVLFEQKGWVRAAEYARIILFAAGLSAAVIFYSLPVTLHIVSVVYALGSLAWLSKLTQYEAKVAV